MLNLHPNLKIFFTDFDYPIIRKFVDELELDGVVHLLEPVKCANCNGIGKHLYGSMKGHAYTQDELAEDPNLLPDMLSGKYDVPCQNCDNKGYIMSLIKNKENKELLHQLYLVAKSELEYKEEILREQMMLGEQ